MNIIKEVANCTVILRTLTYQESLSHFMLLYDEAKKDFPNLKTDEVRVKHYGGNSFKGTNGIEFTIGSKESTPESYQKIAQPHLLL